MQTDLDMDNKRIKNVSNPISDSDAINKLYCDNISYYAGNHTYRKIFSEFYDLLETSRFNLIQVAPSNPRFSGVEINRIDPNLIFGTNRGINDYLIGFGLKLSTKTYIQTTDTFNQNSSFTFFISFRHDRTKTCEINWMIGSGSNLTKSYPRYRITNDNIIIDANSQGTHGIQFPSRYQNKKLCLWICYDGSKNLYKMALVNYPSYVNKTFSPPMNFQSSQLEIDFEVHVNKIGFSKQFIDVNSMDFYRIMMEEKRNGSYVA